MVSWWGTLLESGWGRLLRWFHSFLLDRSPKVKLGKCCLTPWPLTYGVPQESVLSSMLSHIHEASGRGCQEIWVELPSVCWWHSALSHIIIGSPGGSERPDPESENDNGLVKALIYPSFFFLCLYLDCLDMAVDVVSASGTRSLIGNLSVGIGLHWVMWPCMCSWGMRFGAPLSPPLVFHQACPDCAHTFTYYQWFPLWLATNDWCVDGETSIHTPHTHTSTSHACQLSGGFWFWSLLFCLP